MQRYFRKIDRVTLKGTRNPVELFTFDVNTSQLFQYPVSFISKIDVKNARATEYLRRENLNEAVRTQKYNISAMLFDDTELRTMRKLVPQAFLNEFDNALKDYFDGNWAEAYQGLTRAVKLKKAPDGPSQTLMNFIEEYSGIAPIGWAGYRDLIEK